MATATLADLEKKVAELQRQVAELKRPKHIKEKQKEEENREREESMGEIIRGGYVTVAAAAKFLSISERSVYTLIQKGLLASARPTKDSIRIPKVSLERYARQCTVDANPAVPHVEFPSF